MSVFLRGVIKIILIALGIVGLVQQAHSQTLTNAEKWSNLAQQHYQSRDYDSSLYYANQAIPLTKQLKKDSLTASLYRVKGNCYYLLFESEKAKENYTTALEIAKDKKLFLLQADVQRNIASICINEQKINEAEKWLEKSVAIYKSLSEENSTACLNTTYLLIACYHHTKKIKDVLPECESLLEKLRKTNEHELLVSTLLFYAECLIKAGKNDEGISSIAEAEKIIETIADVEMSVQFFREKSKILMAKNDSEGAYLSLLEAFNQYPKILNKQVAETTAETETKYKTKLLEEEKKRVELEKQATEMKFRYFLLLIVGLCFAGVSFWFFRSRQLKNRREIKIKEERMTALLEGEEKERERIAKDLHDGVVQDLTAFKYELNNIKEAIPKSNQHQMENLHSEIGRISNEVRELSYQMMPVTLRELGLVKALSELLNRSLTRNNIEATYNPLGISDRLPEKIEITVYRICQELINNTIKHSKATHVSLLLQLRNNALQLTYEDNGTGFDAENVKKGIGLNSLGSRIEMVKGSLDIESSQQFGTTAYIRIPISNFTTQ